MPSSRPALSDVQREQFSALILLDRVITEPDGFHAGLLENRDDNFLEPVFRTLQENDLVEVSDNDRFLATTRGQQVYKRLIHLRQSYLAHFEIFARLDLAEAVFAEPDDPYDDPRWNDLRLAVGDYKGIDPYRIVFLALLSDEAFFTGRDWKFDLALGSDLYLELEDIVSEQIAASELAYETEAGEQISGESVIKDVILQGAQANRSHGARARARALQPSLLEGEADDAGNSSTGGAPYDPWAAVPFYCDSALYVESMWLEPLW